MADDSCRVSLQPLTQPEPSGAGDPTHGPWSNLAARLRQLRRFVESQWHGLSSEEATIITRAAPHSIRWLCLSAAWQECESLSALSGLPNPLRRPKAEDERPDPRYPEPSSLCGIQERFDVVTMHCDRCLTFLAAKDHSDDMKKNIDSALHDALWRWSFYGGQIHAIRRILTAS